MRIRTIEEVSNALSSNHPDERTYTFLKEEDKWFIDLPDYIKQGGRKKDLQMVSGTDELLTLIARKKKQVTLTMDTNPFEGAYMLKLIKLCDKPMGGGFYTMYNSHGRKLNKSIWICDVALFIFGDIPEQIYVRKQPGSRYEVRGTRDEGRESLKVYGFTSLRVGRDELSVMTDDSKEVKGTK